MLYKIKYDLLKNASENLDFNDFNKKFNFKIHNKKKQKKQKEKKINDFYKNYSILKNIKFIYKYLFNVIFSIKSFKIYIIYNIFNSIYLNSSINYNYLIFFNSFYYLLNVTNIKMINNIHSDKYIDFFNLFLNNSINMIMYKHLINIYKSNILTYYLFSFNLFYYFFNLIFKFKQYILKKKTHFFYCFSESLSNYYFDFLSINIFLLNIIFNNNNRLINNISNIFLLFVFFRNNVFYKNN